MGGDDAVAEGGGFEPPEACASTVFKTVAIVRSATPPPITLPVGASMSAFRRRAVVPEFGGGRPCAERWRGAGVWLNGLPC